MVYEKVAAKLEEQRTGLTVPLALPDEPSLAKEYGVSRETLRRALLHLEQRGAVTRKRGVGTYLQPLLPQGDGLQGKRIGVAPPKWLASHPDSRYALMIYGGISQWAEENDCTFTILPFSATMDEDRWLSLLRKHELSGIVWVQPQEMQIPLVTKTAKLLPSVVLGRHLPDARLHSVEPNYEMAALLADRHLHQHGATPYALVGKNLLDPLTRQWLDGFILAQRKRGVEFNHIQHMVDFTSFHDKDLGRLVEEFYLPYNPEVKGLMFLSSGSLHSAMRDEAFRRRMFKDFSVMTFDYSHHPIDPTSAERTITHIRCDWTHIARRAMETLMLLAGNHEVPSVLREEVKLVEGNTVFSA